MLVQFVLAMLLCHALVKIFTVSVSPFETAAKCIPCVPKTPIYLLNNSVKN